LVRYSPPYLTHVPFSFPLTLSSIVNFHSISYIYCVILISFPLTSPPSKAIKILPKHKTIFDYHPSTHPNRSHKRNCPRNLCTPHHHITRHSPLSPPQSENFTNLDRQTPLTICNKPPTKRKPGRLITPSWKFASFFVCCILRGLEWTFLGTFVAIVGQYQVVIRAWLFQAITNHN